MSMKLVRDDDFIDETLESTCNYVCQPYDCGYKPPSCTGFTCICTNKNDVCDSDGYCREKQGETPLWLSILILLIILLIFFVPIYYFFTTPVVTSINNPGGSGVVVVNSNPYPWWAPWGWFGPYRGGYRPVGGGRGGGRSGSPGAVGLSRK